MTKKIIKKRTLNELRQVKTYGYRPPSPSKEKVHLYTNKNETVYVEKEQPLWIKLKL
jgi:hypothetical protein